MGWGSEMGMDPVSARPSKWCHGCAQRLWVKRLLVSAVGHPVGLGVSKDTGLRAVG